MPDSSPMKVKMVNEMYRESIGYAVSISGASLAVFRGSSLHF